MLFSSLLHKRQRPSRRCPRPPRPRLLLEVLESRNLLSGHPLLNVNTDTEGVAQNETTIAVNPTNPRNLIGSANDYPSRAQDIVNDFGYLHAHVTFNGGRTWTEYPIPFNHDLYDGTADPAVAFDVDGTAYLAALAWHSLPNGDSTAGNMVVGHSADGGKNWSSPVPVFTGTGTFLGAGVIPDKEYIAAWGHGNAIATWTVFYQGPGGTYISSPIFASVTHDSGTTWTAPAQISGPFVIDQGSVPVVAADGSIYVAFDSEDQDVAPQYRGAYRVVKVDPITGQALGAPVEVALVYNGVNDYPYNVDGRTTYQDSQFRTWNIGNLTADPTDADHLAVVWSDMRNNPYPDAVLQSADPYQVQTNSDIIISQSFDGGQTWSAPTAIQQPGDQFMPWGAYDAGGRLQIGYYDRSYDPANHKYGYTLASETDRGSLHFTFQQVTTALSDPTQGDAWFKVTANSNFPNATRFLGDYSNIAVTPRGVAAYWTDMRLPSSVPGFPGSSEDAFFALVRRPHDEGDGGDGGGDGGTLNDGPQGNQSADSSLSGPSLSGLNRDPRMRAVLFEAITKEEPGRGGVDASARALAASTSVGSSKVSMVPTQAWSAGGVVRPSGVAGKATLSTGAAVIDTYFRNITGQTWHVPEWDLFADLFGAEQTA